MGNFERMNRDGAFGGRAAPSLARAMYSSQVPGSYQMSSCSSTPNAFGRFSQSNSIGFNINKEPRCILNCSPRVEEVDDGEKNEDSGWATKNKLQKLVSEVEKNVCDKLEVTLNEHYKQMKGKLKRIQARIEITDSSIERLSQILDDVSETILLLPSPQVSPVIPQIVPGNTRVMAQNINVNQNTPAKGNTQPTPLLSWRRNKNRNQTHAGNPTNMIL